LWQASVVVRRGATQNQGLITINLAEKLAGFIESAAPGLKVCNAAASFLHAMAFFPPNAAIFLPASVCRGTFS